MVIVSFVPIIFSSYAAFVNYPGYLSDWHAPVIIYQAIFTLSLYCLGLHSRLVFNRSKRCCGSKRGCYSRSRMCESRVKAAHSPLTETYLYGMLRLLTVFV